MSRQTTTSDAMRLAFCRIIEALAEGEVTSYGDVAAEAGYPRRHRAVGSLLSVSHDVLPWWRVVYNDGRLPPVNPGLQEQRLVEEGVTVTRGKVVDAPRGKFAVDADRFKASVKCRSRFGSGAFGQPAPVAGDDPPGRFGTVAKAGRAAF